MVEATPSSDHVRASSEDARTPPASSRSQAAEIASAGASATPTRPLSRTPLYDVHVALGAKIVPFAGF